MSGLGRWGLALKTCGPCVFFVCPSMISSFFLGGGFVVLQDIQCIIRRSESGLLLQDLSSSTPFAFAAS